MINDHKNPQIVTFKKTALLFELLYAISDQ